MALFFNGGTDQLWFPAGLTGAQGTLAFWFRTTATTTNMHIISAWSIASRGGFGVILNNTANKIIIIGWDATAQRVGLTTVASVNDGNWRHCAYNWNTANGGTNSIYIDGVSDVTANSSAAWTFNAATDEIVMGDPRDAFWPTYVGDIAEVAFWNNRQLDASEIAALAKGFAPPCVNPAGLYLYTPLVRSEKNRKDPALSGFPGAAVVAHPRTIGGLI